MKPTFERLPMIGKGAWNKNNGCEDRGEHREDFHKRLDRVVAEAELRRAVKKEVELQTWCRADIRLEIAKEVSAQYRRMRIANIIIAAVVVAAFVCFAMWAKP